VKATSDKHKTKRKGVSLPNTLLINTSPENFEGNLFWKKTILAQKRFYVKRKRRETTDFASRLFYFNPEKFAPNGVFLPFFQAIRRRLLRG
jgi:hypothetical protein